MTRALIILMLLIAGCTGDGASPPPSTPQADQPASPPAPAFTVNAGPDQTIKLGTTVTLSGSSTTTETIRAICGSSPASHKAAARRSPSPPR